MEGRRETWRGSEVEEGEVESRRGKWRGKGKSGGEEG